MSRVVSKLPLDFLWNGDAVLEVRRVRWLTVDEVRDFLRSGPAQFVVAAIGQPPRWVPLEDCFSFWKEDASRRIGDPERVDLEKFPEGLAYLASEWADAVGARLVLLEAHH